MTDFDHAAMNLKDKKPVVFTAQSCKNFHQRMLICKHVFDMGAVPINPFTTFGYYLYELVDRDTVRNANNNVMQRCDELWVFGEVSDGVLAEVKMFKKLGKPVKYFDISGLPDSVKQITEEQVVLEDDVKQHSLKG